MRYLLRKSLKKMLYILTFSTLFLTAKSQKNILHGCIEGKNCKDSIVAVLTGYDNYIGEMVGFGYGYETYGFKNANGDTLKFEFNRAYHSENSTYTHDLHTISGSKNAIFDIYYKYFGCKTDKATVENNVQKNKYDLWHYQYNGHRIALELTYFVLSDKWQIKL